MPPRSLPPPPETAPPDSGAISLDAQTRTFGSLLKEWRVVRGLTVRRAASELGLSFPHLSRWETGARSPRPTLPFIQQVAVVYGRPLSEVLRAAGMTIDAVDGEYAQIDGAFAALVMHSKLMPFGMDRPEWLHGFSSRQKRQWIQFAINLSRLPLGVDGSVWEIVREAVRKEPPPEAHPDLPEPPSTFAAYLKRLRTERGLSLRDVAADLDVTYRDLRAWEHAQWFPRRPGSAFLMQRIAMIFDQRTEDVHREAGFDGERVDEMASSIATAFRALALHPDLMPIGMDDRGWLDSFSTRQKRQWVEFAHRLQWLLDGLPDGEDRAGVIRLIEGIQGSQNG